MNLDDLKTTWRNEMIFANQMDSTDTQQLLANVTSIKRKFLRSAIIEIAACALILTVLASYIIVFGVPSNLALQMAYAIAVFTSVSVAYRMLKTRKLEHDDWTLATRLPAEIKRLERQSTLLNDIARWYLVPIMLAVFLGSLGFHYEKTGSWTPDAFLIGHWVLDAILCIVIFVCNRNYNRKRVLPTLEHLRELRTELKAQRTA